MSKHQGIVRVKKRDEHPFVMLERATLQMTSLSLKARGLWAVCMSYPDNWEFNVRHLSTHVSEHDGKTAVRSALRELEAAHLASLERVRNEDGTLSGTRWVIYENPSLHPGAAGVEADSHRDAENPDVGKNRRSENPDVGKTRNNIEDNKDNIKDTGTDTTTTARAREDFDLGFLPRRDRTEHGEAVRERLDLFSEPVPIERLKAATYGSHRLTQAQMRALRRLTADLSWPQTVAAFEIAARVGVPIAKINRVVSQWTQPTSSKRETRAERWERLWVDGTIEQRMAWQEQQEAWEAGKGEERDRIMDEIEAMAQKQLAA